jgi:hypothetical protein
LGASTWHHSHVSQRLFRHRFVLLQELFGGHGEIHLGDGDLGALFLDAADHFGADLRSVYFTMGLGDVAEHSFVYRFRIQQQAIKIENDVSDLFESQLGRTRDPVHFK